MTFHVTDQDRTKTGKAQKAVSGRQWNDGWATHITSFIWIEGDGADLVARIVKSNKSAPPRAMTRV
jgi:hypothetical protein